jgi:response regulator RpfG family c-di-GMP phosphodiesterase
MAQPALKIFTPEILPEEGVSESVSQHRILIVDDEEVLARTLKEPLSREGYQVRAEFNALEAMKLLREERYSVVLSDQRMPQMTGLEFLAQTKQIQPDATRILITGVVNLNTVIEAINKGEIYRFIVKPWIREELLASVKNAVQRHELICRNRELQRTTLAMNEQLAALNRALEEKVQAEARHNHELAELNNAFAENLDRSVEMCLKTLQTFYPSLGVQARQVHGLCREMAESLNLAPELRRILEISAWLHDIGLMGVPRRLIRLWQKSPSTLNKAERELIQQHPVLGQELAGFIHHLHDVGKVIRSHHERFDGKGYPDGLSGEDIPWLGRLLAVAVAFASEISGKIVGLENLQRQSGTAFDPEAVRLLLRCQNSSRVPRGEKEILLSELQPGMVLAKGIYGSNGLLLMPEGQILSKAFITKLQNHHRVNPIRQTLLVYC